MPLTLLPDRKEKARQRKILRDLYPDYHNFRHHWFALKYNKELERRNNNV